MLRILIFISMIIRICSIIAIGILLQYCQKQFNASVEQAPVNINSILFEFRSDDPSLVFKCPEDSVKYASSSTFADGFFYAVVCVDSTTNKAGKKIKPKCPPPASVSWEIIEPYMHIEHKILDSLFSRDKDSCQDDSCGTRGEADCVYLLYPANEKNYKTQFAESNDQDILKELFSKSCGLTDDKSKEVFATAQDISNNNEYRANSPFSTRDHKQHPCIYKVTRVVGKCKCYSDLVAGGGR